MNDFSRWQTLMLIAVITLGVIALAYRLGERALMRRQQRKRIMAARVRSGLLPLEIPTTLRAALDHPGTPGSGAAGFGPPSGNASLWGQLGEDEQSQPLVDEQPLIHIRYLDIYGRYAERTIQVELLDLHRQALIARTDHLNDPRSFPLSRIAQARDARSGRPVNLGLWVDAVRVARRRREAAQPVMPA
ncbi:MAG: hypothetical protein QM586_18925 [Xenophilus sp.]